MRNTDDTSFLFTPAPRPALPIRGDARLFPVHRIYCIGRNYADHAREMGGDPAREPPFFFQKNPDDLVPEGSVVPYPPQTRDLHHEIELVVALQSGGSDIPPARALDHVFGYAAGLDLTRRDLQGAAKKAGRPWEVGKTFTASAPCSALAPARDIGHPARGRIWLDVNGVRRQEGDVADLIWSVPEIVAELSRFFRLEAGDLIFTGTPAGVGAVSPGDGLSGGVDGVATISVTIG